jgi:hypothetical protein
LNSLTSFECLRWTDIVVTKEIPVRKKTFWAWVPFRFIRIHGSSIVKCRWSFTKMRCQEFFVPKYISGTGFPKPSWPLMWLFVLFTHLDVSSHNMFLLYATPLSPKKDVHDRLGWCPPPTGVCLTFSLGSLKHQIISTRFLYNYIYVLLRKKR